MSIKEVPPVIKACFNKISPCQVFLSSNSCGARNSPNLLLFSSQTNTRYFAQTHRPDLFSSLDSNTKINKAVLHSELVQTGVLYPKLL